ncbi:MAG: class I SAM-dependent methyltransferase [Oscillospiraceae bacterium]|nr:class I SAM-dependent methyltransferase [Oscillospiraceae bacterium]
MKETETSWDRMAAAYDAFTAGEDAYSSAIEWPCVREMLPELSGKSVIDLGCGTGRFTFLLEEKNPASITGVDLSGEMLRIARANAQRTRSAARFRKADVSEHFTDEVFDFVFSSTLTHYIADLDAFFRGVDRMLAPRGACVFSVMHPVYTAQYPIKKGDAFPDDSEWTVRYLDGRERACIQPWIEYIDTIKNFLSFSYHHTFGDYIRAIVGAGMVVTQVCEPLPPADWERRFPERYNAFIETPSYLILAAQKP